MLTPSWRCSSPPYRYPWWHQCLPIVHIRHPSFAIPNLPQCFPQSKTTKMRVSPEQSSDDSIDTTTLPWRTARITTNESPFCAVRPGSFYHPVTSMVDKECVLWGQANARQMTDSGRLPLCAFRWDTDRGCYKDRTALKHQHHELRTKLHDNE